MASAAVAPKQYLDNDGNPIVASPSMKLPAGYSLLSSKGSAVPKKKVKELKEQAAKIAPVVPPSGYLLDPDATLKAGMPQGHLESYTPSFLHQVRNTIANSAVGRSIQQEMPKVASALNITPSETIQSPTYKAHGEQLLAPEYMAPSVASISPVPLTQAGRERVEGALGALGNMTSGKSMATMAGTAIGAGLTAGIVNPASAQLLSRLVSGGFTLDMLHGLYSQNKEYRKAVDSGDIHEAHKIQGEMGVNGVLAALGAKHTGTPHPVNVISEHPETGELQHTPAPSEPIQAYHGTPAQFEGAPRTDGLGAHFTLDPELAKKFATGSKGRVIEARLGIKNPLRIKDHGGSHALSLGTIQSLVDQGVLPKKEFNEDASADRIANRADELLEESGQKGKPLTDEWRQANNAAWDQANTEELARAKKSIQAQGYDGLVYENKGEGHGDAYVAFEPHQISVLPTPSPQKALPIISDRRVDSATRKRVEHMTPEEMRQALLTSDKTGIPNRRAFDDAEHASPSPAVAMSDADGLKALNDRFGYAAGDELLKAKAEALKAAGLDAYHDKGDEFMYRGASPQDLKEKLDKAREILRNRTIEVTLKDGTKLHYKGADFSYGTGKNLDESEEGLKAHKSERERSGERAPRGELRGTVEPRPEGSGNGEDTPK